MRLDQEKHKHECSCGGTFRASIADMAAKRTVRCSGGHDVQLAGDGGRKVQKALNDLERTLRKFGR